MSTHIISGRFGHTGQAQQARDLLLQHGLPPEHLHLMHLQTPPRLGEAEHQQAVSQEDLQSGTLKGAAAGSLIGLAAGAAASAAAGPVALLAGAAIGAYGGSLAGTLQRMDERLQDKAAIGDELDQQLKPAQPVLAVLAGDHEEAAVIRCLQEAGAQELRRSVSEAQSGSLRHFHPDDGEPLRA